MRDCRKKLVQIKQRAEEMDPVNIAADTSIAEGVCRGHENILSSQAVDVVLFHSQGNRLYVVGQLIIRFRAWRATLIYMARSFFPDWPGISNVIDKQGIGEAAWTQYLGNPGYNQMFWLHSLGSRMSVNPCPSRLPPSHELRLLPIAGAFSSDHY